MISKHGNMIQPYVTSLHVECAFLTSRERQNMRKTEKKEEERKREEIEVS